MASQIQQSNSTNTIFLTEQEADRIRNTAKETAKKCSGLLGHAREPRNPRTAISQATGASLMADMNAMTGMAETLPVITVGHPYPPCILPLADLKPIRLAELQMGIHHRGRQLVVKRASPVVMLAARSWTMVQDIEGEETERLEVCLHKSRYGRNILESASLFIIKEPFLTLTDQREATLCIDHPSDLVVCEDAAMAQDHLTTGNGAETLARIHKDAGNAALNDSNLPSAHAKYTEGLEVAKVAKLDLARDISRNRAHVNLLLHRFDEALSDAQASFLSKEDQRSKELDSKAYFRAGTAAYSLGEYHKAQGFFEEQKKLMPEDKNVSVNLRRTEMRLSEERTGAYNWKKIQAGLSRARPRVDAANFLGNVKVGDSPGRGRGMFATRSVPAGDIVMCEKAFSVVWSHEEALSAMTYDHRDDRIRVSAAGLVKSTVEKLLNNPSQIDRVLRLYGDYQGDGASEHQTDDGPVVDTFRIHDIVSRNAFGPGSPYGAENARRASTGLWIWAAYINHSCLPNLKREFIGDLMILRAARPITAGEEVFHSYDDSRDYDARRATLMSTWGFECDCALCQAEAADDVAVRRKRQDLAKEADTFVEREGGASGKMVAVAKARRLARAIDETYDDVRWRGVPRTAKRVIEEWLAKAGSR